MGNPAFAVLPLTRLIEAGHDVSLVVTQGSKPVGRGQRQSHPPVALAAQELALPLFQPKAMRSEATRDRIREARPDAIVVVAFGRILPPEILAIPPLSCLNVHFSLLPRHRGAAPVSEAILAGDAATGISIMVMEEGLDTGPILSQVETLIAANDDQITLTARLAELGAHLLVDVLPRWAAGTITPVVQEHDLATWTRPTMRSDAQIDWSQSAESIWRRVRAFADWPQAFTRWNGKLLRILQADYATDIDLPPGKVAPFGEARRPKMIAVGAAKGALLPLRVGLEGKNAAPIAAFLQGYPQILEATLGPS